MRSPVLYFFLLVLQVSFDFIPDVIYKRGGFSEILSEEGLEFVLIKRSNPVLVNLSFVLLPTEIDPISKEQSRKEDALRAHDIGLVKMIFTLSAEVITLYM